MTFIHKDETAYVVWLWQNSMQRLAVGDEAEVVIDGIPDKIFKGKVTAVILVIAAGNVQANAMLLNQTSTIRPGRMPVLISITATQIGKPAVGNVATGVPIGIGADNVEVMRYADMACQFCTLEVDMAWGWDNIRWVMNRAGIKHDGLLRVTHKAPDNTETLGTHYSVSLPVILAKMLKK